MRLKVLILIFLMIPLGTVLRYYIYHLDKLSDTFQGALSWYSFDLIVYGVLRNIGLIGLTFLVLLVELLILKWPNSSFKRLWERDDKTTKVDKFYFFLAASGFGDILSFVLTLGVVHIFYSKVKSMISFSLIGDYPFFTQFLVLFFVNTFLFYLVHRAMHAFFWEMHTIHHSAEEMNIVTPFRNHPFDEIVTLFISIIPASLLGANQVITVSYLVFNGVYQLIAHSNLRVPLPILSTIFITPSEHRLHHARENSSQRKNFGVIRLWDYLFGTYQPVSNDEVLLGVKKSYESDRPLRDIFSIYFTYIKQRLIFGYMKRFASKKWNHRKLCDREPFRNKIRG